MLKKTKKGKKKQRRGFTLVELLAVIVILAIILAIAVPTISSLINDAKEKAFAANAKMVLKAIDYKLLQDSSFDVTTLTAANVESLLGVDGENIGTLAVTLVNGKPSVSITGTEQWDGLLASGTFDSIAVTDTPTGTVNTNVPNAPVLAAGMTPIKWVSGVETVTTASDPDWYDYTNKLWANAKTADGSYWVWIPRYAYTMGSAYHTGTAGTIGIKFLADTSNTAADGTTIVAYSNGNSATSFVPHPAFTFGSDQLAGIWVSKFEASNNSGKVASKPNVTPWTNIDLNTMYNNSLNIEKQSSTYGFDGTDGSVISGIDTHMMKNTEWGAVAYLSHSSFGKNSQIWINNIIANLGSAWGPSITGCVGDTEDSGWLRSETCPTNNQYNTTTGYNASATGNITGIYDISGGSWEYVMGNVENVASSSGLTPSSIPDKYIDRYSTNYSYNNTYYGDAYFETSAGAYENWTSGPNNAGWYSDYSAAPHDGCPWFIRGSYSYTGSNAGAFSFGCNLGNASADRSFRSVVLVAPGL